MWYKVSMHLWTGKARCYFNSYDEGPLFWSVDNGDIATEVKCSKVTMPVALKTSQLFYSETVVDVVALRGNPRAWIHYESVRVEMIGTEVRLYAA